LSLFDRLGGDQGIAAIVADFTPRVLQDPRVNWERNSIKRGGFSLHSNESVAWKPTPENIAQLQKHLVQFVALATGGPAQYDGKDIKSTHAGMHIGNPEFDAVIGDLKASLDKLQIPNTEQKELLAIVESTRPQIVTQR
jgi:hemoglobin